MENIKILIADDHHLVAESLFLMLNSIEGFEISGIVNNGWQALSFVQNNSIDIVLTDYHMPLLNGIEMTMRMKETSPKTKSIILTMSEDAYHIKEALKVDAFGYVMKSAEKSELIIAIKTVAKGEKYFSERIIKKLAEIPDHESPNGKTRVEDVGHLTKREIEILKLVVEDLSNIEIGHLLNISSTTVETHRRNLMKKLGVSSAIGLLRWGMKHGLLRS